jgi:uncharacterized protein (DUF2062 family)/SAM-dependent methyltransferase
VTRDERLPGRAPFGAGLFTRYLYRLRTEGRGRGRQAAAIGLGVFIGCLPVFGLHFWMCLAVGSVLRLNRLKLYFAANVSNPLMAPLIVFSEIQAGCLARHGTVYPITLAALRAVDPWCFVADLAVGSLIVGGVLGGLAAGATWMLTGRALAGHEDELITEAAAAYLGSGILAWEFANGKLRMDPVYLDVIRNVPLPDRGRILDLGCGRGLMLALLAAHYRQRAEGAGSVPLHGMEYRPRMVRQARGALADRATIDQADLTTCDVPACRTVLLLDVLHCLPEAEQEALLCRARDAVEAGGLLIVREADAGAGWRFTLGQVTNRAVAILQGRWGRRFYFRNADDWARLFERCGFVPEIAPLGQATPYANVLVWARRYAPDTDRALGSAASSVESRQ